MAEFLLELLSEEIPAGMQVRAEGKIDFEVGGVKSGNTTLGLFNDTTPIKVNSFDDYCAKLKKRELLLTMKKVIKKFKKMQKNFVKKKDSKNLIEDEVLN